MLAQYHDRRIGLDDDGCLEVEGVLDLGSQPRQTGLPCLIGERLHVVEQYLYFPGEAYPRLSIFLELEYELEVEAGAAAHAALDLNNAAHQIQQLLADG